MGNIHAASATAVRPDFCTFHRILNRAAWSPRAVARQLLILLVKALVPSGAPVVIGFDDTIERRWGTKISARGIYRDPVRSSKGHFVKASGLRWLSAMLLVRVPWADHVMALPFLTLLAPSKRFYSEARRSSWIRGDRRQMTILRSEHIDSDTMRPRLASTVTFWRPVQECTAANAEGRPGECGNCPVGQLVYGAPVQAFGTS
jgi:DDE superfamily endonuclease